MKLLKNIHFYKKLLIIGVAIYIVCLFVDQQKSLATYKNREEYYKDEIAKHRDEIAQIMQQTVGIKGYAPGNGTYVADISIGGQVIERQILKGDIENIKNQINVDKNQIAYENIVNYIKNVILAK